MEEPAMEIEASLHDLRVIAQENGLENVATRLDGAIDLLRKEAMSRSNELERSSGSD